MIGAIYIPIVVLPSIFVGLIGIWWAWDDRHKLKELIRDWFRR